MRRRDLLRGGLGGLTQLALLVAGPRWLAGCSRESSAPNATSTNPAAPSASVVPREALPRTKLVSRIADIGPLGGADANGVRLPPGFTSRVVAQTHDVVVGGKPYVWHKSPDGGAVFPLDDGGWIYVSNSEEAGTGGVGAIRFDASGAVVDAYSILHGTTNNCAGGPTPWNTWLSCEEFARGQVHECDPKGTKPAAVRPALGSFKHEAVTVDPVTHHLYLTEDEPDGCFYRFAPTTPGDLSAGLLEVAVGSPTSVTWKPVPDPGYKSKKPTRQQVAGVLRFNGGEGIWWHDGVVYFSTKGDNRIHAFDTKASSLRVLYDAASYKEPMLTGVDNVTVSASGDVLVAEDGGHMKVVAILPSGEPKPLLQLVGYADSEITGPAFDPSGQRLYFSSQRGRRGGTTFEVTGPFHARV